MKFNKLIPELKVSNIARSLDFYRKILGFKVEYDRTESKFAFLSFQGSQVMLEQIGQNECIMKKLIPPFGRGIHMQMEVRDIKPIIASLKKNKHPLFIEPHEKWYRQGKNLLGNRQFLVQDPDGYLLRFFENLGTKSVKRKS